MSDPGPLAQPFPSPPAVVASALDELRLVSSATEETVHEARRVALLERPWDPASCGPELRRHIYAWLDQVVAWVNEEHTWRPDNVVPTCWDLHPHIVHEIATVGCLRWEAGYARTPTAVEEWHRYTLPAFLARISDRIGATGCPPGRHLTSPGLGRHRIYRSRDESGRRRSRRSADAEIVSPLDASGH